MSVALKLSDELVELAKSHALAGHRSVPKQIEYWARLGKAFVAGIASGQSRATYGLSVWCLTVLKILPTPTFAKAIKKLNMPNMLLLPF